MRVLHLGKYYPPHTGGIETVTYQLAEGMTARGIRSDVLCFNTGGPTTTEERLATSGNSSGGRGAAGDSGALARQAGLFYTVTRAATPWTKASSPLSPAFISLLRRMAPDYDILHLHCPNPMGALALRLVNPRARIVLHWHSDIIRQERLNVAYRMLVGNWLARRADAVIGATPAHVEASEYASLFAGKSRIIPFCLDPAPFAPELVDQAALARLTARHPGRKAVFALGRLISYKGFEVLIDAAALLPDDYVVLIGGVGPLEGSLRERIAAMGLLAKVELLGEVPQRELSAYYHFSRVFCLPSVTRAEMYGMVQLEAFACGRPVVSTRIPGSGVACVNEHGVTGLTVAPGDPAELSRAVAQIGDDDALRASMSRAALAASRERFSPGVMLDAVDRLYRSLA